MKSGHGWGSPGFLNVFLNCEVLHAKMECVVGAASSLCNRAAERSYFCCHQLGDSP